MWARHPVGPLDFTEGMRKFVTARRVREQWMQKRQGGGALCVDANAAGAPVGHTGARVTADTWILWPVEP